MVQENENVIIGSSCKKLKKRLVVGVGGAGCNILNTFIENYDTQWDTLCVDLDPEILENSKAKFKFSLISELKIHGKTIHIEGTTCGNYILGSQIAFNKNNELKDILKGYDFVVVIAGLAGGTGPSVGYKIIEAASSNKASFVSILLFPFAKEGNKKISNANHALSKYSIFQHSIVLLNQDKIFDIYSKLPIEGAVKVMNLITAEIIHSL